MKCPQCNCEIARHLTECSECGHQLGFPNVRQANEVEELAALKVRYDEACADLGKRGLDSVRAEFEQYVRDKSRAVICRKWGTLAAISETGNDLFRTYYEQLKAEVRKPLDNGFDNARLAVDTTFFPYFYENINFAALTLNGCGPQSYGDCHFTFKELAVSHKTTVFEENTLVFCNRHKIVAGQRPPAGYVSTWHERGKLAVAKLGPELKSGMGFADYSAIIMVQKGKTDGDQFLECHVFGRLTISNIEAAMATKPKSKEDEVLAKRAKKKLAGVGVTVSELK